MFRSHARRPFRLALLGGTALFPAFAPLAAIAADPVPPATADTSTVEVTGTKLSPAAKAAENKPQAASVIGQQQVQDLGATKLQDLAGIAPGVIINNNTPSPNNLSVYIRGIGEPDAQGIPSVGIFIDGIYQPRNLGANLDLLGLQDVTIERGPVGFEGGHDAEGGAVRLTTLAPSNTLTLNAQAGYGTYNEFITSILGSGPIVPDLLYGSLAVSHHGRDGIDTNAATGLEMNNTAIATVRGKLRYTPSNDLEINLGYDFTLDNSQVRSPGNAASPDIYASNNPLFPKG